jgi:hypothetical protein
MAGFTIAQAVTGEVDISADGTLLVRVTREWPADAGVAIAAVVVAAAASRLVTAALDAHRRAAGHASSQSAATA